MTNAWLDPTSATNHYYDGDYPSEHHARYPENFDATTVAQGLRHDVARYLELARDAGGPVLELCCGTGRVALPLAAAGHDVVGVDFSAELLGQLDAKLAGEAADLRARIEAVEADVTRLDLGGRTFPLALLAFNSLLCLTDFKDQCRALERAAEHLADGGTLLIDAVNPLRLPLQGDPVPKPFFTRRNPHTGRRYTRFASMSALDENHVQRLVGWYDELDDDGVVTRRPYEVAWRPAFRFELELMLQRAGLEVARLEGGHRGEPYTAQSDRMFVHARRRRDTKEKR